MLADEASDERALLVTLLGAVGIESIQLCRAEDDRDLLSVIQQRGSLAASASVLKSAHFSTLVRHSAHIAALLRMRTISRDTTQADLRSVAAETRTSNNRHGPERC